MITDRRDYVIAKSAIAKFEHALLQLDALPIREKERTIVELQREALVELLDGLRRETANYERKMAHYARFRARISKDAARSLFFVGSLVACMAFAVTFNFFVVVPTCEAVVRSNWAYRYVWLSAIALAGSALIGTVSFFATRKARRKFDSMFPEAP